MKAFIEDRGHIGSEVSGVKKPLQKVRFLKTGTHYETASVEEINYFNEHQVKNFSKVVPLPSVD